MQETSKFVTVNTLLHDIERQQRIDAQLKELHALCSKIKRRRVAGRFVDWILSRVGL